MKVGLHTHTTLMCSLGMHAVSMHMPGCDCCNPWRGRTLPSHAQQSNLLGHREVYGEQTTG